MFRDRAASGFGMIEMMVVVLIIAILVAMAIPTFLTAREQAHDRAVQSDIRNAHAAERVFFAEDEVYTDDPALLTDVEPSLSLTVGDAPSVPGLINLHVRSASDGALFVSARSDSGNCFYLRDIPGGPVTFARDKVVGTGCPMAGLGNYTSGW